MKDLKTIRKWHCFFEQSGTFKNEFKKLGLDAVDYDILDDFGQTDFKVDLFAQIEAAYEGGESVFDKIGEGEAIFAFFPCVRFEKLAIMHFQGTATQLRKKNLDEKMRYAIKFHRELSSLYELVSKLVCVCYCRDIPLILENPYSIDHYLYRYWPLLPKVIDVDRRQNGDYYVKPTQYYFVCCEPLDNVILDEPIANYPKRDVLGRNKVERSLISPDYARRFIRTYLKEYDAGDACKW